MADYLLESLGLLLRLTGAGLVLGGVNFSNDLTSLDVVTLANLQVLQFPGNAGLYKC